MSLAQRKIRIRTAIVALAAGTLLLAITAHAGPTPALKCQAGKNKTAGKYAACRENAEAKLATSGNTTKYGKAITKCANKFATAWQKLEDKAVDAGTTCPSVGDATLIAGKLATITDLVAALVGGNRFGDNLDGTVTDRATGLQWEQKTTTLGSGVNLADPHDVDNTYTWSISPPTPNGSAFTDFLASLNSGGCFAGHCDWRLPSVEELHGIIDLTRPGCSNGTAPCIDSLFGSTNFLGLGHWTATSHVDFPNYAYVVDFTNGGVVTNGKPGAGYLRAVRGGS